MITIGELREIAQEAIRRHDVEVAELITRVACQRAHAATVHGVSPQRWPSAALIPVGTWFRADTPLCDIAWRREEFGCRAMPPVGTGRLYGVAVVDRTWAETGDGFVEVPPIVAPFASPAEPVVIDGYTQIARTS
ncbi:hypothetical protein [Nocardia farcinica]|uniref:hypothetical protein n=1 Tax=Nocardia farcinica TaxID=37329 RepID=UPI0034210023